MAGGFAISDGRSCWQRPVSRPRWPAGQDLPGLLLAALAGMRLSRRDRSRMLFDLGSPQMALVLVGCIRVVRGRARMAELDPVEWGHRADRQTLK